MLLVEDKVQIEAIKTREYMAGKPNDDTVIFTEGHFIVYVDEKDCLIDISKTNEIPREKLEGYNPEKLEGLMKPIELTNKALISEGRTARLFENKETGHRIFVDNKYVSMFRNCKPFSIDTPEGCKMLAFKRNGKLVGLVLPMIVSKESEF